MVIDDSFYMSLAISKAWDYQLLTFPNPAVGAVVVKNGEILSVQAHECAGKAHAEVLALKYAYIKKNPTSVLNQIDDAFEIHNFLKANHNEFFRDCEVFITLEPCNHTGKTPACSDLLVSLKPKRVIFSVFDPNLKATGGYQKLIDNNISVTTDILKKEGLDLLYPFFTYNRQKSFMFFKLASRLNGSIDGGYITSKESLMYVHKIRSVIDLLVIGGNTVRTDRPILDCRFYSNSAKAPNVLIYSKQKNFDLDIPLFGVGNRKVEISSTISKVNKYIMVEGGYSLLNRLKDNIDMFVLFVSPHFKNNNAILVDELYLEIIFSKKIGNDQLIFLKKKI